MEECGEGRGECCLYVEYRSMGESPDISGAWNVREREGVRWGQDCAGVGWLVAQPGTVVQYSSLG